MTDNVEFPKLVEESFQPIGAVVGDWADDDDIDMEKLISGISGTSGHADGGAGSERHSATNGHQHASNGYAAGRSGYNNHTSHPHHHDLHASHNYSHNYSHSHSNTGSSFHFPTVDKQKLDDYRTYFRDIEPLKNHRRRNSSTDLNHTVQKHTADPDGNGTNYEYQSQKTAGTVKEETAKPRSNPFGNAKPVDQSKIELEIKKRLEKLSVNSTTYKLGDEKLREKKQDGGKTLTPTEKPVSAWKSQMLVKKLREKSDLLKKEDQDLSKTLSISILKRDKPLDEKKDAAVAVFRVPKAGPVSREADVSPKNTETGGRNDKRGKDKRSDRRERRKERERREKEKKEELKEKKESKEKKEKSVEEKKEKSVEEKREKSVEEKNKKEEREDKTEPAEKSDSKRSSRRRSPRRKNSDNSNNSHRQRRSKSGSAAASSGSGQGPAPKSELNPNSDGDGTPVGKNDGPDSTSADLAQKKRKSRRGYYPNSTYRRRKESQE